MPTDDVMRRLDGANMNIVLTMLADSIVWDQGTCL